MEEENVRELRSSRSRSNTPFIRASRDRDGESIHGSEEGKRIVSSTNVRTRQKGGSRQKSNLTTVTESHTTESVTTHRYVNKRSGNESDSSVELIVEEEPKSGSRKSDRRKSSRRLIANGAMMRKSDEMFNTSSGKSKEEKVEKTVRRHKTSDYSSEDGEGAAFQVYKQAGDWWNKFPKTDYTYSPISHDRKEVAPGVIVMPNMSRRSLNAMRQHGISSSESNLARASAVTSVTSVNRHQKSKGRWTDPSTSNVHTSRKVYEEWAAVDSDVDDVAERFSTKSSSYVQNSWTVTTYITSFFMTIWTFISSSYTRIVDGAYRLVGYPRDVYSYATPRRGVSPVTDGRRFNWLWKIFSWFYKVVCSVMHLDLLLLSNSTSKLTSTHKPKLWRLLLLLLPLLFLTGWLYMSESNENALNPVLEITDTMRNTIVGWMYIPFGAYSALKERLFINVASPDLPPVVISTDEQKTVDMESLARYILTSSQFQQQLASKLHMAEERTKMDKEQLVLSISQQNQLHQENSKLLEEHNKLLGQLTANLKQLQDKMDHVKGESDRAESREKEWQLRWEEEKLSLKDGSVADQILLRKELRDLQSRFRLLQEQQAQMMRRCCQRGVVNGEVVEQQVIKILADLLGATGGQYSGNPQDLHTWVGNMILAKEDLEAKLINLSSTLHQHTRKVVLQSKDVIMASVKELIQNEFAKWQELQRHHEMKASINSNNIM
ncbi:hypothetical protein L9F63_009656, partial [Diploptera punctata]